MRITYRGFPRIILSNSKSNNVTDAPNNCGKVRKQGQSYLEACRCLAGNLWPETPRVR